MKYTKQILEAINRGIRLALDDFDDEVQDQAPVLTKKKIQNYDPKDDFNLYNMFIDLGLPSGTLWCKYNLGCDYDLLNNHPENSKDKDWAGKTYKWGMIDNTPYSGWVHYPYAHHVSEPFYYGGDDDYLTKYCNDKECGWKGFIDNLTQLLPEDDAAYQYNSQMHIPTKEQFEELEKYTTPKVEHSYLGIQNLVGIILTSKINGKQLFLNDWFNTDLDDSNNAWKGFLCFWTSSLYKNNPFHAYYAGIRFYDSSYQNFNLEYVQRCNQMNIRPVINLN